MNNSVLLRKIIPYYRRWLVLFHLSLSARVIHTYACLALHFSYNVSISRCTRQIVGWHIMLAECTHFHNTLYVSVVNISLPKILNIKLVLSKSFEHKYTNLAISFNIKEFIGMLFARNIPCQTRDCQNVHPPHDQCLFPLIIKSQIQYIFHSDRRLHTD